MKINVLDHGYVELAESWGSDERIIEEARQSTAKGFLGWGTPETPGDEKLLRYLWENKHSTPFEFAGATLHIQCPIFVIREWHRHRTQSYSEMSARYVLMPDLHFMPEVVRAAGGSNKQGSQGAVSPEIAEEFTRRMKAQQEDIYSLYYWAIENGVAKELARMNTPVSRYTRMGATANLRNWLAFLTLRQAPNAQYEIRVYADAVAECLGQVFPRTMELFRGGQK